MSGSADGLLERYFTVVAEEGIYPNRENLEFYLRYLFDAVPLEGKKVLEIGGGAGWLSLFTRCRGATRVVCLEPEVAGSSRDVGRKFRRLADRIGVDRVSVEPVTLQKFDAGQEKFEVIIMHDSINHLDEEACIGLKRDKSAIGRYRALFGKIGRLACPGAMLVVTDCSRYNFFAMLRLNSPVARTIEWEKHQSPWTWAHLLYEAGFRRPRIRWSSFNRLGRVGRLLLGNPVAAFFLTSHFCLTMTKTHEASV